MASTTLAPVLVGTSSWVREVGRVMAGVVLIGSGAQIAVPLPFTPVPITGQTFAVLLIGGAYGVIRAGGTVLTYLALGSLCRV